MFQCACAYRYVSPLTLPLLISLPPVLPTLQKEKMVKLKAEEGHSMILNCNPPQSSMQPIIHWMDWSEYIISPLTPHLAGVGGDGGGGKPL